MKLDSALRLPVVESSSNPRARPLRDGSVPPSLDPISTLPSWLLTDSAGPSFLSFYGLNNSPTRDGHSKNRSPSPSSPSSPSSSSSKAGRPLVEESKIPGQSFMRPELGKLSTTTELQLQLRLPPTVSTVSTVPSPTQASTMATRFDKLDKHIDRLEKLFSRRKRSVDSNEPPATNCASNNTMVNTTTTTGIINGLGNINRPGTPAPFLSALDANSQTFPEPSFIRPTSSRMMAREEVHPASGATRRAKSLPESPTTPRLQTSSSLTDDGASASSASPETRPPLPPRRSSFGHDLTQRSSSLFPGPGRPDVPAELIEFSFAAREAENDISPTRRSRPGSKALARSTSVSVSPKARVDRKRLSATGQPTLAPPQQPEKDERPVSPQPNKANGATQPLRESPCLAGALRERPVRRLSPPVTLQPKLGADLMGNHIRSRVSQRPTSLAIPGSDIKNASEALRKSISLSTLPSAKTPTEDPTLKEPSLTDFLALSDDDIADDNAAPRSAPSPKPLPSMLPTFGPARNPSPTATTPLRAQGVHPLLTLSPPLATRPTAAAAFEAARIASKYQLDLVYVVNLWPGHISHPSRSSPLSQMCGTPVATSPVRTTTSPSSPPHSPASIASGGYDSGPDARPARTTATASPRGSGMTGRLLAAYGLPAIMYPFRISAPVHQKVLRTEGWLEYRNGTGARDEFARGYSCSFYTGHSPARREASSSSSPTSSSPTSSTSTSTPVASAKRRKLRPSPPANRGIVFAAFRLPRADGATDACGPAELEALHRDAEALVDMLIDIHMTQRGRPGLPASAAATAATMSPSAAVRAPAMSSPTPMPYHNRCAAASAGRRLAVNAPLVAI